jgi:hypothetical protein
MAKGFFFTGEEGNHASRRKLAEMLFRQGNAPIQSRHWMEDAANAAKGILGAYQMSRADREQAKVDRTQGDTVVGAMREAGLLGARPDAVAGSTGMEAVASPAPPSAPGTSSAPAASGSAPGAFGQIAPRLVSDLQRDFGLSREQAAGIAGPLAMESAGFGTLQEVRPLIPGSRGGFGYAQWTGPRRRAFESWSQQNGLDPTSYEANYGFLRHELQNTGEGRVLQSLRGINDPQAAAQTFTNQFLRPGIPNMPARMNWTNRVLGVRAPQDRLEGGDGSEAPMIDGRNLPDSGVLAAPDLAGSFDQMRMAAPGPMDPRARSFDQITRAGAGMQPSQAVSPAPSVDDMMAGSQVVQQMQAPMPVPRPEMPMQAPMPMARPNMEPPPGAQPAMAPQAPAMGGMSERDRLMMLRDEGSLAPGEADRIRAALTGASPMQAPVNPMDRLRQMVMGGGSAPAAPSAPAMAQGQPTASAAAPAAAPAGDARSRLLGVIMNPNVSPTVRQAAMMAYQSADPTRAEQSRLALEQSRLGIEQTRRSLAAPIPNSPEAAAAQRTQREADADRAGLQGEARRRFVLTGNYEAAPETNLRARNEANAAEGQRLGLTGERLQYYTIHGKLPDSVGNVSASDKRAGREAIDQIPALNTTISALERARSLNNTAYSGLTAGALAAIGTSGLPGAGLIADPKRAETSREFNQIMTGEAIAAMANTLAGVTTDAEMNRFIEILGNSSTPPAIRERTIDRMLTLARQKEAMLRDRAQLLPENERRSLAAPAGAPPPGSPPSSGAPEVGAVVRGYRFKGGDPSKQESWERAQ